MVSSRSRRPCAAAGDRVGPALPSVRGLGRGRAGRAVKVLGFPFGRKVEVGKPADAGVIPQVSVTAGSFSAAREDEAGSRGTCRPTPRWNPGNSGGPMLDEDGYVVGVVRMKLARDATARGPGSRSPSMSVKDFLEANGLLGLMPVARLRPGVRHSLDWKGSRSRCPTGTRTSRRRARWPSAGEIGEIGFRAYRLATSWPVAGLEEAILGGGELPGFVPAPASAGRRQAPRKRLAVALPTGTRRASSRRRQASTLRADRSGWSTRSWTARRRKSSRGTWDRQMPWRSTSA